MSLNRAYSVFDIKAVDEEQRILEGVATTPSPDRVDDIVEAEGGLFALPLPFLWQHSKGQPAIGHVIHAAVTKAGIRARIQLERDDEPGPLKDYLDLAWRSIKKGLVRGLSIGFRPIEAEPIKGSFGTRFTKWEWLELSAVTIPANQDASIALIKSLDAPSPALSGTGSDRVAPAAVVAPRRVVSTRSESRNMTTSEQIKSTEASREAKAARMIELQELVAKEGRTKEEKEQEEFDTLKEDITRLDKELSDLRDVEKLLISRAQPANGQSSADGSASRGGVQSIRVEEPKLPPGIGFARGIKARLVARLDGRNPLDVAKEMYPSDTTLVRHLTHLQMLPQIEAQIKAAVPAATTTNTTWAGALIDPTNLASEFIEYLRPATIIGRLNLRRIPFNVRMIEQTQGGTGYWVGQGAPKPLTAFGFAPVTLGFTKVAAITVATEEAVRFASPSLDASIRDSLRDTLVERIDRDLLDPAEAGTTNVQPASLTNGVTPLGSAGTSADNVRTDLSNLVQAIRSANLRGPIAIVMPDSLVTVLTFLVNSLGQMEFPDLNAEGGSIRGLRVIGSDYLANASGSGNMVVAIAEREVFLADDGQVMVDASREASLQMLDNPTNNSATATATQMVSMWQTDSIAFRAHRFINWAKRRADAVAYIDDVNWASVGSP